MRIHIGVPTLDHVPIQFAMSLASMLQTIARDNRTRKDIILSLAHCQGSMIWDARNTLANQALEVGASHLLFLDSDMTFPPDTVSRLATHHKPIVGASYVKRFPPHPILGIPHGPYNPTILPLAEMATIPMGCCLIRTEIFRQLPYPWFKYEKGSAEDGSADISEDVFFCNLARASNIRIFADVELTKQMGHVGTKVYTTQDTKS